MNFKKVFALAAAGVLTVGLLAGCGSSGDSSTVVMGTEAGFPPFEMIEGQEVVGIDPDIAKEIAEDMGKELKIEDMAFDGLTMALTSGKIDFAAAGMSIDPEKDVDFSEPYYEAYQAILVRKDGSSVAGATDITADKKIGVQNGTTGDSAVTDNGIEPERYNKYADAVMDLKNGKLDAIVVDSGPAEQFVNENADLMVLEEPYGEIEQYAIAVKKGNTEMLEAINSTINRLKESGELDEIIAKYDEQ